MPAYRSPGLRRASGIATPLRTTVRQYVASRLSLVWSWVCARTSQAWSAGGRVFDKIKAKIGGAIHRRPWLDHVVRAGGRFNKQRGNYYAAGITYFTVLSMFPLLMVGFSVVGFVLSRNPHELSEVQRKVIENVPGSFGNDLNKLINTAINSRGTVGVLGLLGAFYAGLGWISNLRAALTEQWDQQAPQSNWFKTKFSDLLALIGLGIALVISLGFSALSSSNLGRNLLKAMHIPGTGATVLLTIGSLILAVLANWAVFVWIIARLPRQPVTIVSAVKAAFIAAVAFEIWKQIASFYLQKIVSSPAGVAFGPIIGLMVFAYFTARIILFATAWAATARENEVEAQVPAPGPAVIEPRIRAGLSTGEGAALVGMGALVGALAAGVRRRR